MFHYDHQDVYKRQALESVEDVRRSLLIALIDRKITKYFSNFDGLVKKLENERIGSSLHLLGAVPSPVLYL